MGAQQSTSLLTQLALDPQLHSLLRNFDVERLNEFLQQKDILPLLKEVARSENLEHLPPALRQKIKPLLPQILEFASKGQLTPEMLKDVRTQKMLGALSEFVKSPKQKDAAVEDLVSHFARRFLTPPRS